MTVGTTSLSARRAWIEMPSYPHCAAMHIVALRKESVDRNMGSVLMVTLPAVALRKESVDRNWYVRFGLRGTPWSLSARRAWIEMIQRAQFSAMWSVALRKESVDRNSGKTSLLMCSASRSPQGERG